MFATVSVAAIDSELAQWTKSLEINSAHNSKKMQAV